MLFLTAVCTLVVSTFKDEYAHDINHSTYRGIPKLLVHLDVEITLRAPLNLVRKLRVRICSKRFGKKAESPNLEPHLAGLLTSPNLNSGAVRVRFGFGMGSEPDPGNTTTGALVAGSRNSAQDR
jgi:hypothetical protein